MISGVSNEELNFLHELSPFLNDQVNQWTGLRKNDESCLQQLLNDNDVVVDLDLIIPEIDQNFEIPDLDGSSGSTQLLRR